MGYTGSNMRMIFTANYMTGRDEGTYKGFEFRLNGYMGYEIKDLGSFQPYAGNKLVDNDTKTIRRKLLYKIKYTINKELSKFAKEVERELNLVVGRWIKK